ncbi:MAG: DUF1993 family protein [Pseudomonadota bacterium]
MTDLVCEATVGSVKHYLGRIEHVLGMMADQPDGDRLLGLRLAPDMLDTGFNFAVASGFGARALCPPAGLAAPEIPEEMSVSSLLAFNRQVSGLVEPLSAADMTRMVTHKAGEADLTQAPADYIARFALPNMIFHFTAAYAGLRHGGVRIGKADFDGLHVY